MKLPVTIGLSNDEEILLALTAKVIRHAQHRHLSSSGKPWYYGDVGVWLENGWYAEVFFDCGDWDYINLVVSPDGRRFYYTAAEGWLTFGDPVFNFPGAPGWPGHEE